MAEDLIPESLDAFFTRPPADLNGCDLEPIHVPGAVQAHGVLLVLDPDSLTVRQASANTTAFFGVKPDDAIGLSLEALAGNGAISALRALLDEEGERQQSTLLHIDTPAGARSTYAAFHRNEAGWIVELEPAAETPIAATQLLASVENAMQRLRGARTIEAWCDVAAEEVRRLSGFDRVMVYRFDDEWHGQVVAEARREGVDSFLGLHFPAADIPKQARRLYVLNPLRYIADVHYTPVPIRPDLSPVTGKPLDLSYSLLRSVSPVHIEYLQNMGVGASLSISIVKGGELWGLIACHHAEAYALSQPVRAACGLLGQMLSLQLPLKQESERAHYEVAIQSVHSQLIEHMTRRGSVVEGLTSASPTVLELIAADGAAVLQDEECTLIGQTPPEAVVRRIARHLPQWMDEEPFATDRLPARFSDPEAVRERASGLLAIPIGVTGRGWVLWFREEMVRAVTWAGDRTLAEVKAGNGRISPRESFEQWREIVRGTSVPWHPSERAAARALQHAIIDVVLRRAEEVARLNQELAMSNRALELSNRELQEFATIVAHDLKEPLRKISTFASLLGAEFGASASDEGSFFLSRMQQAAIRSISLVNDLLSLAQISSQQTNAAKVALDEVVMEAQEELAPVIAERGAQVRVAPLPTIRGDRRQLVKLFSHLLDNALKFQPPDQTPEVHISGTIEHESLPEEPETPATVCVVTMEDNGIGFDPQYADRVFKPFQQLHARDEFDGTGIGLALCRRIVEQHGGTIGVESEPGVGSRFTVRLPMA